MIDGPGVRWEGYSHEAILEMVNAGPGPALTEAMETWLKSAASTLTDTADTVNAALQRLNAGEWQGGAANAAAGAMQVVRDFDDGMHFHSVQSDINAFGQSDSTRVTRANVPPKVDVGPAPDPTGTPMDIIIGTENYEDQQRAATEAEKRAREVMAEYTTMSTDRVSSMPQLSVPPQVVFDISGGTADPPPGGPRPPGDDGYRGAPDGPAGGSPGPRGGAPAPGPGGSSVDSTDSTDSTPGGQPPAAGDQPGVTPPASTDPARVGSPPQPTGATPAGTPPGPATDVPRGTSGVPVGGFAGGPGPGGGGRSPGGSPGVGAGPGVRGEPGARGAQPGAGARGAQPGAGARGAQPGAGARGGGLAEAFGRGGARGGGFPGMAPVGGAGAARGDEDKEHDVKYGVPSAAYFEPDNDDGVWRDPYRPGSHVAPPAIGDDDNE